MEQLKIPTLYCPFPSIVNRHAATVDQQALVWAKRWNLLSSDQEYRRLHATGLGWLAARTHPEATLAALQLVADWCIWLFVHDDYCDESGFHCQPQELDRVHQQLRAILAGYRVPTTDDPLGSALADLAERTRRLAPADWFPRFQQSIASFFSAGVWEAENRAHGIRPDLATYRTMRPFTSGMYVYIDLIDVVDQIVLPPAVRSHPTLRSLAQLATHAACWVNDMLSVVKELRQGDVHNLVLALQHKDRLSLQDALNRAGALHDAEVRSFIDMASRLPSFGPQVDPLIQRYLGVLHAYMRGNLDWSFRSGRYILAERMTSM